jgi:HAD superfamily phosphatase (TIGR01668 family)
MNKNSIGAWLPNFLDRDLRRSDVLAEIDLDRLIDSGIEGIILDLDNTIVSEDDRYLSPHAIDWIVRAKKQGFQLFILSNGKRNYRVKYWSEYLDIPAINPARKPFPRAFRKAMRAMQLAPDRVVVIGDSLHTDLMGAWIVGCPHIQVASLPHPPRWWEKLIGKYIQIAYPIDCELGDFQSSNYSKHN